MPSWRQALSEQGRGNCILPPPIVQAFHGSKVEVGKKLQQWQRQGLRPLAVALIGVDQLPPLWTHPTGSDFVRGSKLVAKPTWRSNESSPGRKSCYFRAYGRRLNVPITATTTHHGLKHAKPLMSFVDKTPACNSPMTRFALCSRHYRHDCESNPATPNWPSMKSLLATPTPNITIGKKSSWKTVFPSNAFMASARSLHMFNRSKKMNCNYHAKLSTCR